MPPSHVFLFLRRHPKLSFILVLVCLTLLCYIVSEQVVTERERISNVIMQTSESLQAGDIDGTMRHVATDFSQENMDRAGLRSYIESGLSTYGKPSLVVSIQDIAISENRATCELSVKSIFPEHRVFSQFRLPSSWVVRLKKSDGRWEIIEVMPVKIGMQKWSNGLTGLNRDFRDAR
jgi:hypothetical protein